MDFILKANRMVIRASITIIPGEDGRLLAKPACRLASKDIAVDDMIVEARKRKAQRFT